MRLVDLVDFNPRTSLERSAELPFIDMAALPVFGRDVEIGPRRAGGSGAKFRNGDTLLARITPCLENGKGAQVRRLPGDGIGHGSTEFIVMRAKDPGDENFVYYLTREPAFRAFAIQQMSGTSGRQRVSWQSLTEYQVADIPKSDRSAIGTLLGSLDDKIELNRRMSETLEAMAQAIFRDWFVDFGPVRRKMEGATNPVVIMGGLTPDAARAAELSALFPGALTDHELPEDWRAGTLAQYAILNPESWSARNAPEQVEYVDLSNTKWGEIENTVAYSWTEAPSRARRVVRPGDTLVGTVRPGNGSYAYVGTEGLTASTGFAQLRPKALHFTEFVYLAATCSENIERLSLLADGGAYPAVNPSVVLDTTATLAPDMVILAFAEFVSPLQALIVQRKAESRVLAETRDCLLPRLMSGQVSISEKL